MDTLVAGNARPVVDFAEPLTSQSCINLVDRIRRLRDDYFYSEVQLRLSSPGGEVVGLEYYLEAVSELREGGFRIDTHGVARVSSGGALMLSMGDERTAHPKCLLNFHAGRLPDGVDGALTAAGAASIADSLNSVDHKLIALLAERAARSPCPAGDTPRERFSAIDWRVISKFSGNARRPDTALRRFRKRVADAFDGGQEKLGDQYAALFSLDAPISAHLALEFGLLDAVSDGKREAAAQPDDPGLTIPQWEPLYPKGQVPRSALTRHTLILGETGSGKTMSGIMPVLASILRDEADVSCALVIDPKHELLPIIERKAGPSVRVRLLRAGEDTMNLMWGVHSISDDVASGKWMLAAKKLLARASSFSDSPARILAGKPASSPRNAFWEMEGSRLAQSALALTLLIAREDRLDEVLSSTSHMVGSSPRRLAEFARLAGLSPDADGPRVNALAAAKYVLDDFFSFPARAATVLKALQEESIADGDISAISREINYWGKIFGTDNQFSGSLAEARTCFHAFSDPTTAKSLMFGVEGVRPTVDFSSDMGDGPATDGGRTIYVFQPGDGDGHALIARVAKAAFFESVLASEARRERGGELPLIAYVADEFHRFITSDSGHGEQNFLDRARSFGAACVLATQSDASIRHALAVAGEPSPDSAIRLLLTNTATKLVFRSTEAGTRTLIDGFCPGSGPNRVTVLRPPSTLRPGEVYASLPTGEFVRRQLKPLDLSRPTR